jgi:hypothetical protein
VPDALSNGESLKIPHSSLFIKSPHFETIMKKITIILATLSLTACASMGSSTPAPTAKLGKVIEKETVINQTHHQSPVDIGIGIGGGGNIGWGLSVGLGQLLGLGRESTNTTYQYKIKLGDHESLAVAAADSFEIGSCVTVLELADNRNYPKVQANPNCQLAAATQ